MTIEELDQENQTLQEVIFDLEKLIVVYKKWIARNDADKRVQLTLMAQEAAR